MNILRFPFWILLVALVGGCGGCTTKTPDPLAGFYVADIKNLHLNKVITDDYKQYILTLSPDEQKYAGPINFFEDGTGQHAVKIIIGINGTVWEHVLVYDKNDKRIKSIKYSKGGYHS